MQQKPPLFPKAQKLSSRIARTPNYAQPLMLPPPAISFKRLKPLTNVEQLAYEIEDIEAKLASKKTQLLALVRTVTH